MPPTSTQGGNQSETLRKCLRIALPLAVTAVAFAAYFFATREEKNPSLGSTCPLGYNSEHEGKKVEGGQVCDLGEATDDNKQIKPQTQTVVKSPTDLTTEEFIQLLEEMLESQNYLERLVEDITNAIRENKVEPTFSEVYKMAALHDLPDPIQRRGLKIPDFDVLVEKHGQNEKANRLVEALLQGSLWQESAGSGNNTKASYLSCDDLLEVNRAMLTRLQSVVQEARNYRAEVQHDYDTKIGSATAQAILSAYLKETYDVTANDLERALVINEVAVSTNPDFIRINDELHVLMAVIIDPSS